jgi:hypothetical protein
VPPPNSVEPYVVLSGFRVSKDLISNIYLLSVATAGEFENNLLIRGKPINF